MCKPADGQEDLDAKLLGTWSYCEVGRYQIVRAQDGRLLFVETHSDGKEASGTLRAAEDAGSPPAWQLQADVFARGEFCGLLRMRVAEDSKALVTAFKPQGSAEWTHEATSQRLPDAAPAARAEQGSAAHTCCWPSAPRTRLAADLKALLAALRPKGAADQTGEASARPLPDTALAALANGRPGATTVGCAAELIKWLAGHRPAMVQWGEDLGVHLGRRLLSRGAPAKAALGEAAPPAPPLPCDGSDVRAEEAPALALDDSFDVLNEEEVGALDLELEAERILADDWGAGNLLVELLEAGRVYDIEAGPWLDDESGGVRVRDVRARVPLSPMPPFVPESSRVDIRYRILVERKGGATTITVQGTWCVAEVPYGDYFNTVDHLTLASSAAGVKATQAVKVHFHKSTIFQSMLESATKNEVKSARDGSRNTLFEVIRRHVKG